METSNLPLSGVRILDMSIMTAGPISTMMLADLGADVIKVEEIRHGDHSRNMGAVYVSGESSLFMSQNRNKRSTRLDLKRPEGRDLFLRLAAQCDVVLENFRPGTVDKLGVGYDDVCKVKPDIIYASLSAFGQTGPYAHLPANEPVVQALSGLMAMTGEVERPVRIGNPYPDFGGAALLAFGISAALFHRERTGEGRKLEVSLLEGAVFSTIPRDGETLITGKSPGRYGTAHPVFVPYQNFKGSDGQAFFLSCFTEKFWASLCEAAGRPEWKDDPRFATNPARCENRDDLIPQLEALFASQSCDHWVKELGKRGVPAATVQDLGQALREDPQVAHMNMVVEQDHPRAGKVETLATPVRFTGTPPAYRRAAPVLGEHTDEVLGEFGLTPEEIETLYTNGIIAGIKPAPNEKK